MAQEPEIQLFGKAESGRIEYYLSKNKDNYIILTTEILKGTNNSRPLYYSLIETKCQPNMMKILQIGKFTDGGELAFKFNPDEKKFGYFVPGTVNEKLLMLACGESSYKINAFPITVTDLIPELYIDMYMKAQKYATENFSQKENQDHKSEVSKPKGVNNAREIDYYTPKIETGDFGCSNIIPQYDRAIDNKLSVINKGTTDVVVKLMNLVDNKAVRIVYIKEGDQVDIKNIPQGKYYLKEAYGKVWKQKNIDGMCIGEFTENAVYKKGENIADFTIRKTITATHENYQIPSYSLEIGVTFSKGKKGNHITNTISSTEFNK